MKIQNQRTSAHLEKQATTTLTPREFMRPAEYAVSLGISHRTLRSWLVLGVVPHVKIGRVILIDPLKAKSALQHFERKSRA
jgi:hypothetical protein